MKKIKKIVSFVLIIFVLLLLSLFYQIYSGQIKLPYIPSGWVESNFTGSNYKGNYVYGAAMNLAWNELGDNIIEEEIKLNTNDKKALEITDKLNKAIFTKKDLDEASYYVKSGFGNKTVELINKESKEKFPSKSFDDIPKNLEVFDAISYAYFLKEVEYEIQFEEKDVLFNGQKIKGFYADNEKQKNNVIVLYYENDDKFIVKLKLKDNSDELILAKGFDMNDPDSLVKLINEKNNGSNAISGNDLFEAPNLHLDYSRDYKEMLNIFFANKNFEEYYIAKMFENIKFDMDYKGARVENEGVIIANWGSVLEPEKVRKFILDKPYWVVMKRSDRQNPYFVLGVNNTELMEK